MAWLQVVLSVALLLPVVVPASHVSRAERSQQTRSFRKGAVEMTPELRALLRDPQSVLLMGEVALAKDEFPANRWYDYTCGGTLVWENVLITAAHCVSSDETITVLVSGTAATCECDPDYTKPGEAHDVAACLTDNAIKERLYETVDLNQGTISVPDPIMLTGFAGRASSPSGVDLMGRTTLESLGSGVFTTRGGAWVSKGDSGSTAYTWKIPSNRRLIAVNSDIAPGSEGSLLSSLAPSASFLSKWAGGKNTHICGLDGFVNALCRP